MTDEFLAECTPTDKSCPRCGTDLLWHECGNCAGDGFLELYEEDPLWYDEDDTETCDWCDGRGGCFVCPDENCRKGE